MQQVEIADVLDGGDVVQQFTGGLPAFPGEGCPDVVEGGFLRLVVRGAVREIGLVRLLPN